MVMMLSDATAAPTALPIVLRRLNPAQELDPRSAAFSLRALHAAVMEHERAIPQSGAGALRPAQRRYLERFTPDIEEALNLFS
jgi:hypothetical protein